MTQHTKRRGLLRGAAVLCAAVAVAAGTGAADASAAPSGHDRAHHASHGTDYVALGDSYASGPGIPEQTDAACARSDHNYPSVLAAATSWRLTDVSCTRATTAALAGPQDSLPPQFDALDRGTDVVTLTIGGNDLGFSNNLATCAQLAAGDPAGDPCHAFFTSGGTDQLAQRVQDIAPRITEALHGIRQRAPHARVYVVGYPDLFPEDGVGCTSAAVPIAAGDFGYLRDTEKRLNAMLAGQARAAGVRYVDTYTPTIGHDMCRPAGERWIEPLVPTPPAAPAHPNALGEHAMAAAVRDAAHCGAHRR
ncbi:GDSL-like Lipase/Acylhydrolase family protein [Actinacidiphila alni]|uniref:GDSL-like Lipase/Acylhydrolase family protein n=1 Tax=Actinacidiphila alni TaxID=380248 RepID=A0A1I2LRU9_9ACTN|nr:SGNH/GDSL hydrolase family protein [Actinacidiphila alni]SFF81843.1 GDSL-like Lipase/Acylhydrolase family protein [Actinacidiphila alni]